MIRGDRYQKDIKPTKKATEPVIEYYKKLNLLKVIDGERSNRAN